MPSPEELYQHAHQHICKSNLARYKDTTSMWDFFLLAISLLNGDTQLKNKQRKCGPDYMEMNIQTAPIKTLQM